MESSSEWECTLFTVVVSTVRTDKVAGGGDRALFISVSQVMEFQFLVGENYLKGYLSNLLEITLLPQFFVF